MTHHQYLLVFVIIGTLTLISVVHSDLCLICDCHTKTKHTAPDSAPLWINCTASNRTELPLDNIPWITGNQSIALNLEQVGYTYLPKLDIHFL